ncbi:MAG: putative permease [Firmicutes bacterium ADurb.Bin193]|nr:MAG: putative permease [Firmicutes bacterium ADurb.Bin193]
MIKALFKIAKRYKFFLFLLFINIALAVLYPVIGMKSLELTWNNTLEMLTVIPPIFILLGLLDVWVKRETMVRYMGEGSGIAGVLIAFFIGSAAAGPLYAAFPVAGVLLKKGSKLLNVFIMLGAWSTTKIPLLLFESSAMGYKFMVIRLLLDLVGITAIAFLTQKLLSKKKPGKFIIERQKSSVFNNYSNEVDSQYE